MDLPKEISYRIGHSPERIRICPHHFVKMIVGTNYFRLRPGDYKAILGINNKKLILLVVELGHRKNIHKN